MAQGFNFCLFDHLHYAMHCSNLHTGHNRNSDLRLGYQLVEKDAVDSLTEYLF